MTIELRVRDSGKNESPPKKVVTLWLRPPDIEGYVMVSAEDGEGNTWYLLQFSPDGTFNRIDSVGQRSGFQTDDRGRIIERTGIATRSPV